MDVVALQEDLTSVYQSWLWVECLNTELFTTAPEFQLLADRWRWEYNTLRLHSALRGRTPLRLFNKELPHDR
jgi:transposase InsO family protein